MIPATASTIGSTSAAPTSTASSAADGQATGPFDFLLTLGQLVATGTDAAAAALTTTAKGQDGASDSEELPDDEAIIAALAGMLPVAAPPAPATTLSPGKNAGIQDLMMELEFSRDAAQPRIPLLGGDADAFSKLTSPEAMEGADSLATFESALSPHMAKEAPTASRALTGAEASLTRTVHTPVGSAAWADEIGSRLTLMAEQGKHTASLRLAPEHLGPLEIRIAIRDDQASVWFGAAHADTRAAIEHALPRLREMFESQGMSLADAGVHHEPPREHAPDARASGSTTESQGEEPQSPALMKLKLGLVDAYA